MMKNIHEMTESRYTTAVTYYIKEDTRGLGLLTRTRSSDHMIAAAKSYEYPYSRTLVTAPPAPDGPIRGGDHPATFPRLTSFQGKSSPAIALNTLLSPTLVPAPTALTACPIVRAPRPLSLKRQQHCPLAGRASWERAHIAFQGAGLLVQAAGTRFRTVGRG